MEFLREAMIATMAAVILSLLVAVFLLKSIVNLLFHKKKYPPVAGTIFHLLLNLHDLLDFNFNVSLRFKTYRFLAPTCNYIGTVDPTNVEYILKTNFTNFGKGSTNYDIMKDFLGDGIFAVDGERWRHQRNVASYVFSATQLRDYGSLVFRHNAVKLCKLILEAANSNKTIDIQELFMKLTMDSVFKLGFGEELDTLSGSNHEGMIFAKAFDGSNSQTFRRYVDIFWKIKRFLNVGLEAQLKKDILLINTFVYNVINRKIEQRGDSLTKEDMISRILKERGGDEGVTDKQYLRDIMLNILIAGRDTTAATLSWFFYMLCKHPDVQEKVAKVVREALMGRENLRMKEFPEHLTGEVLNGMHYLHAALSETLRLYPSVPFEAKHCFSDDVLPDGFDVKKGDLVVILPYTMGRMKFLWGEDAGLFRPERWLNVHGFFEPESSFKFTVFQAGPRICLGKDFAYKQMKIVAATLLYYFKFDLSEADQCVNYKPMLTLQIDEGLHLRASSRIVQ